MRPLSMLMIVLMMGGAAAAACAADPKGFKGIRRCAIQLQRRDVCFIPITSRYLKADAAALGYEHDALTQLNGL